jgi:tRNA1Val (adenine37-N6)-methyltransferase
MPNSTFEFKQFKIKQDRCAMKVGTDAVLLGAWADVSKAEYILDIGTGTGIIALMMAQRCNAEIDAIDIDKESTEQARLNALESKFKDRIEIVHTSFQHYYSNTTKKYDLIVSNPPYFIDSLKNPGESRSTARHSETLPFNNLLKGVKQLLSSEGKFCLILPKNEGLIFRKMAEESGFFLTHLLKVRTAAGKEIEKRHLMQFELFSKELSESTLQIEKGGRHDFTEEYIALTKDFYLHF